MKDNFDIFFRRKPALMLVSLKKNSRMRYGSVLAKEVDCTYSHAVKILQTLEELGLVEFEKKGRIKLIKLTKKGQDVAQAIENIRNLVKWITSRTLWFLLIVIILFVTIQFFWFLFYNFCRTLLLFLDSLRCILHHLL